MERSEGRRQKEGERNGKGYSVCVWVLLFLLCFPCVHSTVGHLSINLWTLSGWNFQVLCTLVPGTLAQHNTKSASCVVCSLSQINELTTSIEPSLLLPEDFKAFSKIRVENQFYNKWAPTFTSEQLGYVCLLYDRMFLFTLWQDVDLFYIRTCLFTLWQDVCVYPVIGRWFYSTSGCVCLLYDKMWTLPNYVASFPAPRQRPGNEDIPAMSVSLLGGGYIWGQMQQRSQD